MSQMESADSVFIYYRPGSYVPAFRRGEGQNGLALATERAALRELTQDAVAKAIEISSAS